MKHQSGVTLIELLVTLSIAVILMTVAIPNFQDFMRASRTSSIAMDQMGALNVARSEAIKRGAQVVLCSTAMDANPDDNACGGDWTDGMMAFVDTDADSAKDAGEPLVKVFSAVTSGYTVTTTPDTTTVVFDRMGRATAAISFAICADGSNQGQQVQVTATRIRMSGAAC